MLFMVVAEHAVEMCPGGNVRPDKEFIKKTEESMKKSGVKLIDAYMDAPGHALYFVLEAADNAALNIAVEPIGLVGDVTVSSVMKFFKKAVTGPRKWEFKTEPKTFHKSLGASDNLL